MEVEIKIKSIKNNNEVEKYITEKRKESKITIKWCRKNKKKKKRA
jgi:hypothetical protein